MAGNALGGSLYLPFQQSAVLDRALQERRLAIAEEESARNDRAVQVHKRGQDLSAMKMAWEQSPPGSRQRMDIASRLNASLGLPESTPGVSWQEQEKLIDGLRAAVMKDDLEHRSGKISDRDALMRSAQRAATYAGAIWKAGGMSGAERESALRDARSSYEGLQQGQDIQGDIYSHGVQAGQTAGAQIRVNDARHDNSVALENLEAGNQRRENRQKANLGLGTGGSAPSFSSFASVYGDIIRAKEKAGEGAGTKERVIKPAEEGWLWDSPAETMPEVVDIPVSDADRKKAADETMALMEQFTTRFAPKRGGESADDKRARGRAKRAAEERVKAGQSPTQAAVGAATDEYGPGLVYGLPAAGETDPNAAAAALDDSLALWTKANPGASPEEADAMMTGILKDSGYLDTQGRPVPTHAAALAAVLRKYGLVD